jgi:hypothetical protein
VQEGVGARLLRCNTERHHQIPASFGKIPPFSVANEPSFADDSTSERDGPREFDYQVSIDRQARERDVRSDAENDCCGSVASVAEGSILLKNSKSLAMRFFSWVSVRPSIHP